MDADDIRRDWLFVLGAPRSGTTLMAYLAGLHERCECLYETHFPLDTFFTFSPGDGALDEVGEWMSLTRETSHSAPAGLTTSGGAMSFQTRIMGLIGHGINFLKKDSTFANSDARTKCIMLTRACCSAIREVCESRSTEVFGDKSPEYCMWWGLLREILPNCKLIFIERDREENAGSMIRAGFNVEGVRYDMEAALAEVERYNRHVVPVDIPNIHRVKLEDVEADPGASIMSMLDYLDLDPAEYPMNRGIDIIRHGALNRTRKV